MTALSPFIELYRPHRYKAFYGGRGSGKSWAVAQALIVMSNLACVRVLCCREVQISIADSSYMLLRDTAERLGLADRFTFLKTEIVNNHTGARFIFRGLMNPDSLKSLEGVDICWIEEAQSMSAVSWEKLPPTIRKAGSEIWVTFNPDSIDGATESRFLRDDLPEDWYVRKVNYDENPHFPAELRAEMEKDKAQDYEFYLHVWEGYPRTISDAQIFKGRFVVQEFPEDLWEKSERLFFGADFGFARDPSTLVRCFIDDKKLYVEYEAYGTGVEIDELPALYRSVPGADRWNIHADCSRPETISYLANRCGFRIDGAKKWQGSIEDGIAYIKSFEKVIIHPRCKHTAEEFVKYSYKIDKKTGEILPIVEDRFNHCIDALRYALDGYITQPGMEKWAILGKL